jgi:hypothetical protein
VSDKERLEPNLVPVSLMIRHEMEVPNKPINDVYFMEDAVASVVALHDRVSQVEIGIIGCDEWPRDYHGHGPVSAFDVHPDSGTGQRLGARYLDAALRESKTLRPSLQNTFRLLASRRPTPQLPTPC